MENKAKQMIDCNKETFETYFNSMLVLQEQVTKALDNVLKQSPWIPEQTHSFINDWVGICKKATVDFKESVNQNYSKTEEVLTLGMESSKPKSKKQAKVKAVKKN